jgi:hypothetical protein
VKCHEVKSWPESFVDVCSGTKTFEVRENDRDYHVGDYLLLFEWDPKTEQYTGRHALCHVGVLAQKRWGLTGNLCVMGVTVLTRDSARDENGNYWEPQPEPLPGPPLPPDYNFDQPTTGLAGSKAP